eukprot:854497-Rhodomonas_salina.2
MGRKGEDKDKDKERAADLESLQVDVDCLFERKGNHRLHLDRGSASLERLPVGGRSAASGEGEKRGEQVEEAERERAEKNEKERQRQRHSQRQTQRGSQKRRQRQRPPEKEKDRDKDKNRDRDSQTRSERARDAERTDLVWTLNLNPQDGPGLEGAAADDVSLVDVEARDDDLEDRGGDRRNVLLRRGPHLRA